MGFAYLYNPDNGICGPYSEFVASNRSDLVPLREDEGRMLRTMSVADILARRAANSEPIASVTVETADEPHEGRVAPAPVSAAPAAKGVTVVGEVEKPAEVDEFNFVDAKKDYKRYFIRGGEEFPVGEIANVPNEDLVRFAKEVLGRNYSDAPELGTDEERDAHYAALREKLARSLARIYGKRAARRAEEARNGGNH